MTTSGNFHPSTSGADRESACWTTTAGGDTVFTGTIRHDDSLPAPGWVLFDQNQTLVPATTPGLTFVPCAGEEAPYTNVNRAITTTAVTAVANQPAGLWSLAVTNVGAANGVVDGVPILPGESWSAFGYIDEVTRQQVRLDAVAIDGTGTTLHVIAQA